MYAVLLQQILLDLYIRCELFRILIFCGFPPPRNYFNGKISPIYIYNYICGFVLLTQVIDVLPSTVRYLAEHISPNVEITETLIHFLPGSKWEHLLRIPFKRKFCGNTTVVIRIGIDNEYPNEFDHDMRVGIADGTYANMFYIVDVHNYKKYPPCYPIVDIVDKARITGKVPMSFKMTLNPLQRYGYCETSQDGGFLSAGVFGPQVDMTKGHLLVQRHSAGEEYFIRYISIEINERR